MRKGLFGRIEQELTAREKAASLTMADLLSLPNTQRQLAQKLLRTGDMRLVEIVAQDDEAMRSALQALVEGGFVRETAIDGEASYSLRIGSRRRRELPLNIWDALNGKLKGED